MTGSSPRARPIVRCISGSFGGGVSVYLKSSGVWQRIGIADGLASIDVPAIAWRAPFVFFGTLGAGVSVYEEGADVEQP